MISNLPQREEFLRKKKKKKIIKYSIIFGTIVIFIALASYISHRPSIRISKIELTGGVLVGEKDLETKTLEYLEGSHIWLFPRGNAFWYPKTALRSYLKDNFKRIDTIETNLKDFHTLSIRITERKPIAIWCKGAPNESSSFLADVSSTTSSIAVDNSACFFIDQNSTIFAPSPIFSGDAYFKYYGLLDIDNPIGLEYIASTTKFIEINNFVDSLKSLSLRPQYVIAKNNDEFSAIISGGGEIFFDTKKPLFSVFENLKALLQTTALSKSLNSLDYIDLRYGNKLFYKLKNTNNPGS
ncbi:MAG: hypothetical protein EXS47_01190 [Candidatus Zambryskibacteria bacterium]|nr:hypothetical protein [Candidatus Zambryskibacteria bacterium]